ncbi:hypothetical protein TDB9533_02843 [Thalassocella blandensis]|nr:hypothetical protein TDB9533_02843 [Thalassocella blandensis]
MLFDKNVFISLPIVGKVVVALYLLTFLLVMLTNYFPYQGETGFQLISIKSAAVIILCVVLFSYFIKVLLERNKSINILNYIMLGVQILPMLSISKRGVSNLEFVDYLSVFGGLVVVVIIVLIRSNQMRNWFVKDEL